MEPWLKTTLFSLVLILSGCATPAYDISKPPKDLLLSVDPATLNNLDVAVYISSRDQDMYYFKRGTRDKIRLGEIYVEALKQYGDTLFGDIVVFDAADMSSNDNAYSLAISIDLAWRYIEGKAQVAASYRVLDTNSITVLDDVLVQDQKVSNTPLERAYSNASIRSVQYLLSSIVNTIKPTVESFPKGGKVSGISRHELIDTSKPNMRLTGTKVNSDGIVMAVDINFQQCLILETEIDGKAHDLELFHQEKILDLALFKTNIESDQFVYFDSSDKVKIGKSMVLGAYQAAPDEQKVKYMFGNVDDSEGLKGGSGIFQFASAVKPLYTGGPIINDRGALIGYKAGSYANMSWLVKNKHLPENVYFGLKGTHIKEYLTHMDVAFNSVSADAPVVDDLTETINNIVLPINCYQ